MPSSDLRVTEHYLCQEGEGSTLGALTYLVRLSGCNLRCWWCDSKFSSFYEDEAKAVSADSLGRAALKSGATWVSFTGGEPTWRPAPEIKALASLCKLLKKSGRKVKFESNGLLLPGPLRDAADLWSIAPKWDGSKPYATQRHSKMDYDLPRLKEFQRRYAPGRLQLKFVITSDAEGNPKTADLKRATEILKGLKSGKKAPVFFIPEAYAKADYLERCRRLGTAIEGLASTLLGWDLRVQPQWHRVLHGDARKR
jgi:7-carboxy-7-deazaguanine synthase